MKVNYDKLFDGSVYVLDAGIDFEDGEQDKVIEQVKAKAKARKVSCKVERMQGNESSIAVKGTGSLKTFHASNGRVPVLKDKHGTIKATQEQMMGPQ